MTRSRLVTLDVFRGLTVALMIIVNSPGNREVYPLLAHAAWDGCTLADLVFPFFLFTVGVSCAVVFSEPRQEPVSSLLTKIFKRTLVLFCIGIFLNIFPHHLDINTIRIFGVLQRIAICYCIAAICMITCSFKTQSLIVIILLIGYWHLLAFIGGADFTPNGNLPAEVDRFLFSSAHLYQQQFDPEGLLSTLPAIATTLLGNLTGGWLLSSYKPTTKLLVIFGIGVSSLFLGWVWGDVFPINKSLWTSTYVLWTCGLTWLIIVLLYWLLHIKSWTRWSKPFELLGLNALLIYVLHVLFLKIQTMILISDGLGNIINLKLYLTNHLFFWTSNKNASLYYACTYLLFWIVVLYVYKQSFQYLKSSEVSHV